MKLALSLSLLLSSTVFAAPPVLRPLPLSPACRKAGYSALQDASGTLRVLRYVRLIPDNTARQTQYYSAAGQLQSVRATASGFVGLLYDLSATVDSKGRIASEKGYRSRFFKGAVVLLPTSPSLVKRGQCSD
jgi:hypothetical protein